MPDYVPTTDAAFGEWLANFSAELATSGTVIGLSADEVADVTAVADEWETRYGARLATEAAFRAATAEKRNARREAVKAVRTVVRRVQAHPATTDTIRARLRVTIADGSPTRSETVPDATPLLRLNFGTRGQIKVHFGANPSNENRNRLPAGAIGAVVQTRSGPDEAWTWLDNPSSSPYTHVIQPSGVTLRQYRCAYLYRKGKRGPWSEAAEAAVTP